MSGNFLKRFRHKKDFFYFTLYILKDKKVRHWKKCDTAEESSIEEYNGEKKTE